MANNKGYKIVEVSAIKKIKPFRDEYVYDIEMEDQTQPWFFANGILIHNSLYFTLDCIKDLFSENDKFDLEKISTIADDIGTHLNQSMAEWARKSLKSEDNRLEFKRERICQTGLFLQKKRYVLHVLDNKGIACDQIKYTGVEVVSTTMPDAIKPHAKQIIETMLKTKSLTDTNKILFECYNKFKQLKIDDIAITRGIKDYNKYAKDCSGMNIAKHTPGHVKAAYYYNFLLEKTGLDKKYEKITSGDKIRFVYLQQPNKYGLSVIAFKYIFPKEWKKDLFPDYEKMFQKSLFEMVSRFYGAVNWQLRKPSENIKVELLDLFG
jgi:DNA polymerase elongation subunit (family B)